MAQIIIISIISFISTNIDDFAVLMILFARSDSLKMKMQITAGQFIGIAVITAVSMCAAAGLTLLPEKYTPLLGLIPIALAVKERIEYRAASRQAQDAQADESAGAAPLTHGLFSAAAVTIADGGDNLGVYIPLFTGSDKQTYIAAGIVFFLLTALWCAASWKLADSSTVRNGIKKYGRIIVPAVYLLIGIAILAEPLIKI
jgi:cadmium resistance protein CadD (predicted permease)